MMEYEFLIRVAVAGLLGALIGLEREKRFKEAGLRTHFLVAVGSAIIMIISKYAFYDVVDGTNIVLDPSRVAAQVVSGIGFLGAGMIIFQRSSVHGLTTAAGIWTTSGIGLAIGAGMYEIGIFGGLLVIVGLEFLKRIFRPIIPHAYKMSVEITDKTSVQAIITELAKQKFTIKDYQVKKRSNSDDQYSIDFKLHSREKWTDNELLSIILSISDVTAVKFE
jgi:putative Mg2+ transporter-C (MgtC) family protein